MMSFRFLIWTKTKELLQIVEIGRDGCNLWLGQGMRNRLHDVRCVWFCWILTPVFTPVCQFLSGVVIELTGYTRKCPVTFSFGTVTGSAWRNSGSGNSLFKDVFPCGHEFPRSIRDGFRIEISKMCGESRYHGRGEAMRHGKHKIILPLEYRKVL